MSSRLSPVKPAFTLSLLALSACDESTAPTQPKEHPSQAAAAPVAYLAQDLEIISTGEGGGAVSINAAGVVVGYTFGPDDTYRGFIWTSGTSTHLGTLGGRETRANDINDIGQVVGGSVNSQGMWRAFRWRNGTMTGLRTLGGRESEATAINNRGHVVGQSQLTGNPTLGGRPVVHAFLVKNGVMSDLGTLGGARSSAQDINDAGQVVGWSETTTPNVYHPFLWQNGVMTDLLPPGSTNTGAAYAINSVGVVVGVKNNRAFRHSGGVMRGLPLGTTRPSVATGIRAGRIVGSVDTPTGTRGFVLAGGQVTLLPLLPGDREGYSDRNAARAINGSGVIVGSTTLFDSNVPPTMWTPQ